MNKDTTITSSIEDMRNNLRNLKANQSKKRREYYNKHMEEAAQMYDNDWYNLRNAYIAEHPLCEIHEKFGVIKPAEEVHHKRIISSGYDKDAMRSLTLNENNLMSLCKSCHRQLHKIAKERQLQYIDYCVPYELEKY